MKKKLRKIGLTICSTCIILSGSTIVTWADNGESVAAQQEESETEKTYDILLTLTKDDCIKGSNGKYGYNGIVFTTEDCEWIDSPLNPQGTVEAGAFYDKLAKCLVGFSMKIANYRDFSQHILGYIPETREEFEEKAQDLSTYIVERDAGNSIMKKFATLSVDCVNGDEEISVHMSDVTAIATELGISEEMLGYILGVLHDYAADISFTGNECTIVYKWVK